MQLNANTESRVLDARGAGISTVGRKSSGGRSPPQGAHEGERPLGAPQPHEGDKHGPALEMVAHAALPGVRYQRYAPTTSTTGATGADLRRATVIGGLICCPGGLTKFCAVSGRCVDGDARLALRVERVDW